MRYIDANIYVWKTRSVPYFYFPFERVMTQVEYKYRCFYFLLFKTYSQPKWIKSIFFLIYFFRFSNLIFLFALFQFIISYFRLWYFDSQRLFPMECILSVASRNVNRWSCPPFWNFFHLETSLFNKVHDFHFVFDLQ